MLEIFIITNALKRPKPQNPLILVSHRAPVSSKTPMRTMRHNHGHTRCIYSHSIPHKCHKYPLVHINPQLEIVRNALFILFGLFAHQLQAQCELPPIDLAHHMVTSPGCVSLEFPHS